MIDDVIYDRLQYKDKETLDINSVGFYKKGQVFVTSNVDWPVHDDSSIITVDGCVIIERQPKEIRMHIYDLFKDSVDENSAEQLKYEQDMFILNSEV